MLGRNRSTNIRRFCGKGRGPRYRGACALRIFGLFGEVGLGVVDAAVFLAGVPGTVVVFFAGVPLGTGVPVVAAPTPEAGVAGGVGNEVSGVGSGGSGLDKTLAIISLSPVSDLL